MSDQKHTPGPWVLNNEERRQLPESDLFVCSVDEGRHREVCRVEEFYFAKAEAAANARLIAAAPEMLKALDEARSYIASAIHINGPDPAGMGLKCLNTIDKLTSQVLGRNGK